MAVLWIIGSLLVVYLSQLTGKKLTCLLFVGIYHCRRHFSRNALVYDYIKGYSSCSLNIYETGPCGLIQINE